MHMMELKRRVKYDTGIRMNLITKHGNSGKDGQELIGGQGDGVSVTIHTTGYAFQKSLAEWK